MKEQQIVESLKHWEQLQNTICALSGIDYNRSWNQLTNVIQDSLSVFNLCPFKVGDLVTLTKSPQIDRDNAPGWMGAKHFLKKGAKGIVKDREFLDGKFIIYVEFLEETYMNNIGKKVVPDRPAHYRMLADYFKLSTQGRKCIVR